MTNEAQTLTFPKITNGPLTDRLQHKADTTDDQGTRSLCLEAKARIDAEAKFIGQIRSYWLSGQIENAELRLYMHNKFLD